MYLRREFEWVALCCLAIPSLCSQISVPVESSNPVFKTKVPVVMEDVVVTDAKGEAVEGLERKDFQIFEAGKPQTIASFEEHKDVPDFGTMPALPPNIFTNYSLKRPA